MNTGKVADAATCGNPVDDGRFNWTPEQIAFHARLLAADGDDEGVEMIDEAHPEIPIADAIEDVWPEMSQKLRTARRLAAVVPAPVVTMNVPRAPRARGRERRTRASRPAKSSSAGADAPPPPLLFVSDRSALAVVGLEPRQFRAFVRERGLESVKVGRRTLVRADVLLRELGLDAAPGLDVPPAPRWSGDALTLRLLKGVAK